MDLFSKVQVRLIFKALEQNNSVFTFSANRYEITDESFEDLADSLKRNTNLEKLELDYNNFTPFFLKKLSEMILFNKKIQFLSIEGNYLTDGQNEDNMRLFCDSLKKNTSLIFLNFSYTGINDLCAELLLETLLVNDTLIMIHLQGNIINYEILQKIQEKLILNTRKFERQRLFEFNERTNLRQEIIDLESNQQNLELKVQQANDIRTQIEAEHEKNQLLFFEQLEEENVQDYQLQVALDKNSELRLTRKKKRIVE